MKLNLPDGVCSPQDLTSLIQEVRDYASWFHHQTILKRVDSDKIIEQPSLSLSAKELLRTLNAKEPLSQIVLDELAVGLEKFKTTAPSMNITLAAPATNALKKTLVSWCRKNLTANILVDFKFNATILGGMVVRYKSHIFDWSFRRQILATRQNFPEVLRRV